VGRGSPDILEVIGGILAISKDMGGKLDICRSFNFSVTLMQLGMSQ
jgi:hypothetical protein